ncbi:MAG: PLP-dependent aminotransferase family protein [Burkholderiales bacterium]|nr:MAG: PLP-dependent aminotransferase family protein [Burkholderiales bacterium]
MLDDPSAPAVPAAISVFTIDRSGKASLSSQLVQQVISLIAQKVLVQGAKLPSVRECARQLQISRSTVVDAYDQLVALRHIQARPRSGYHVVVHDAMPLPGALPSLPARTYDYIWLLRTQLPDFPGKLNVSTGKLPPLPAEQQLLAAGMKKVSARLDREMGWYGSPEGYLPLRQFVQMRLQERGVKAALAQVVLTQSASHAYELVTQLLLSPGDCVLVDDPGYYHLMGHLRFHDIQLIGVPRTPEGPDIVELDRLAQVHRPKLFFTQSLVHNPTGGSLSPHVAYALLQAASRHDLRLVESDCEADYVSASKPRLASLDNLSRVIYVSTFSKTVSPSVRVGYIACNAPLAQDFNDVKLLTSIANAQLNERLAYAVATEPGYRRRVEQQRAQLEQNGAQTAVALREGGLEIFTPPNGGRFVWARHPRFDDSTAISGLAQAEDIILAPGKVFRPGLQNTPWFRVNVMLGTDARFLKFLGSL